MDNNLKLKAVIKDDLCQLYDQNNRLVATIHCHFSRPWLMRMIESASSLYNLLYNVRCRLDYERNVHRFTKFYVMAADHPKIESILDYIEKGPGLKEGRMSDAYYAQIARDYYGLSVADESIESLAKKGKAIRKVK